MITTNHLVELDKNNNFKDPVNASKTVRLFHGHEISFILFRQFELEKFISSNPKEIELITKLGRQGVTMPESQKDR